ncbi:replication protein [Motilimonas cestriensis]|uniref:replication protein n=1 Tax=Motilimonas cestriensis TaxID=2742685 RepID=UPI003DA1EB43
MGNVVALWPVEPVAEPPKLKKEGKAVLDDGYTRLANEIKDTKAKLAISGNQFRVLEAIERFTFGWHKDKDRIANTQIADYCDLSEAEVSRAVKQLVERKVLLAHGDKRKAKVYEINTFVSEWQLRKAAKDVAQTRKNNCANSKDELRKPANTKETLPKENIKPYVREIPTTPPKSKYRFSDDDLTAATWMAERVMKVAPKSKKPNLKSWANEIRLMREQDELTLTEICQVFAWCNKHGFHYKNIQCPSKLRQRFGELHSEMCPPAGLAMPAKSSAKQDVDWNDKSWAEGFDPQEGL